MKNSYFLLSFIFLISIKNISLNKDIYKDCEDGFYGLYCNQTCNCDKWSSSRKCSKNEGRCLDCKFGHFDKNCNNICKPQCKTNLCCAIKDDNHKDPKKSITSNLSTLKITINNLELNISVYYNVGYPLTIFNKAIQEKDLPYPDSKTKENYDYTNYKISGYEYQNNIITLKDSNLKLTVPIVLDDQDRADLQNINGIIGLGFLNSINLALFKNGEIPLNIASYKLNDNKISILFGEIFKEQKDNIERLSYCDALSDLEKSNSSTLKCKVNGMTYKEYNKDALELEGINVQFSLYDTKSTFILENKKVYKDYIKNNYFDNKNFEEKNVNNTIFYCFKKNKKNTLSNFGFVINQYYYSNQAKEFFKEDKNCPTDSERFLVEFSDNKGIIFGQDFFKNTYFTIDNEERKIYFYNPNTEYFSKNITKTVESKKFTDFSPLQMSLLAVSVILVLNIISFLIYFYFKRKKEKLN